MKEIGMYELQHLPKITKVLEDYPVVNLSIDERYTFQTIDKEKLTTKMIVLYVDKDNKESLDDFWKDLYLIVFKKSHSHQPVFTLTNPIKETL
jgi:hypothetical protein